MAEDVNRCQLCLEPCDNGNVCLCYPEWFPHPTADRIQKALVKKGAFTSPTFGTSSSNPPEITVTDWYDGFSNVTVHLTSMEFIAEYRDPRSPQRRRLEEAAKWEIIRSFDLEGRRIEEGDIKVDITEGPVKIWVILSRDIVNVSAATITGLCDAQKCVSERNTSDLNPLLFGDVARGVVTTGAAATGAASGAAAGAAFGRIGMGVGAALGFLGGALFAKKRM